MKRVAGVPGDSTVSSAPEVRRLDSLHPDPQLRQNAQAVAASPALGDHGIFEPAHLKAADLEVFPGRGDAHVVPLMGSGKTVDHRAVILVGGQSVYLHAKVRKLRHEFSPELLDAFDARSLVGRRIVV